MVLKSTSQNPDWIKLIKEDFGIMEKITMNRDRSKVTVQEGFEKYIRLKKLKNLSPETIKHYYDEYL